MRKSAVVALVLALLEAVMPGHDQLLAQDGGFPPLPILYRGEVYVDGELLLEEAELTVRVGDWESRPATVQQDGSFLALIAGPPSITYVDQPITFHLRGMEATYRSTFPLMGQPRSEELRLEFGETAPPTESRTDGTEEDGGLDAPWATLVALFGGGAVLVVVLNVALRRLLRR